MCHYKFQKNSHMKKAYNYFFLVLFFAAGKKSYSQKPFLTIYHADSEKSKDSHSTIENISLTGTTVVYTVKYSGRRGPDQKDETKNCLLSNEQIANIRKAINDKKLNSTDSLIVKALPDESYLISTAITITFTDGKKISKTKVKGNPYALTGKPLYKNSLYLLNMIQEMLKNCH